MSLTIDIGNSRIKWAEWQESKIVASGACFYDKNNLSADLNVLFAGLKKPSLVYSVCVAKIEICNALSQWVKKHWQLKVDYLATGKKFNNVTHGYIDPAEHGADRWAGVIAANYLYPDSPLCVIGAGTALTVDFLKQGGRHLGGYILPSYVSMHTALTGDAANVSSALDGLRSDDGAVADLAVADLISGDRVPNNTNDSVNYGLHRLLQAGVRDFFKQAKTVLGDSVEVVVTGGFAETILSYPDMPKMHHVPDLVMQGLYLIKTTKP